MYAEIGKLRRRFASIRGDLWKGGGWNIQEETGKGR